MAGLIDPDDRSGLWRVGEWAAGSLRPHELSDFANDNGIGEIGELADPFFTWVAEMDIAATREW